ncbi:unnamed protein product [Paramecium sonneborni]|uniref:Uncharacterized protein n=1 Tax=Paramecium sonneborni TaxID=65129 RepID=A0A8S1Q4E2_9CILI|nr:unnamed protein product [Paramecium sonneborni]
MGYMINLKIVKWKQIKLGSGLSQLMGFNSIFDQEIIILYRGSQITSCGEYKNGKKVGRWDILYFDEVIGGGSYEIYDDIQDSVKNGKWIDLGDGLQQWKQLIFNGYYQNGQKVGTWEKMKTDKNKLEEGFIKIKELKYD